MKVLTKTFYGGVTAEAGMGIPVIDNAFVSWLVQEDIAIIGIDGAMVSHTPSENDGFAYAMVELSQTGVFGQEGALMCLSAAEGWNTTPAGVDQANANKGWFLPGGKVVSVKEEGHLYINTQTRGKSAGSSTFEYEFIVYYEKRGA